MNDKTWDVKVVSPDGEVHGPIENMSQFVRDRQEAGDTITYAGMRRLVKGVSQKHKGWVLADTETEAEAETETVEA